MMKLIVNQKQLLDNVRYLDEMSEREDKPEYGRYKELVLNGRCFFPYKSRNGYAFAPSRFIGYQKNNFKLHDRNDEKDGRLTNKAISKVLCMELVDEAAAERIFVDFCKALQPDKNVPARSRKYWITDEFDDLLDLQAVKDLNDDQTIGQTEKEQIKKARIGQGKFRDDLVKFWQKCCATGINLIPILRASHIKPWRESSNRERLDPFNGLLLTPNLDVLFDSGRISFEDNGAIKLGEDIDLALLKELGWKSGTRIGFDPNHLPYLRFHRNKFFGVPKGKNYK